MRASSCDAEPGAATAASSDSPATGTCPGNRLRQSRRARRFTPSRVELESRAEGPMSTTDYTGAQMLVEYLAKERVEYAFGVCGHGIIGFLDALYDRRDSIRTITAHDEQAAGFMADAYYRLRHRPAVTYSSCGPGSLNLTMAVANAFYDSSAFLAITGSVPKQQFTKGPVQ